jgi:hypothetical protein
VAQAVFLFCFFLCLKGKQGACQGPRFCRPFFSHISAFLDSKGKISLKNNLLYELKKAALMRWSQS